MPDPGGPDRPLIFAYDNGPAQGPPIVSRPNRVRRPRPRWPGLPGWLRRPGRPRLRLKRPHPFRRLADFLILLAAAAPEQIGSRAERFRYITVGLLMIVATVQAFYSAALFMSVSLGKPLSHETGYGVFFAAAVYLIDRSIISYAAPIKLDKEKYLLPPKKTSGVAAIRVGIAIAAALLMSEMILLQVFAGDIKEQVQNNQIAAQKVTGQQIRANFQARIAPLQQQIDTAQNVVDQRQSDVDSAYKAMNCQEFGCPAQGITGGIGPGFAAAKVNWQNAVTRLNNAQSRLKAVRDANQSQIKELNREEQQAINAAQPAISHADKVLSQEEAFWQLTVKNGTVLVVRLLLTLLILGIDLAPIMTKLTGRTSMHDILGHSGDYRALEKEKHEARTAVHRFSAQGETDRKVHGIQMDSTLFRANQEADVARTSLQRQADVARATADAKADAELYRIDLDAKRKKFRQYRDFMAWQSGWANGQGGGGNPGGTRSPGTPGGYPGRPDRPGTPGGYPAGLGRHRVEPEHGGVDARADPSPDVRPPSDPAKDYQTTDLGYIPSPVTPAKERHAAPDGEQQAAGPAPAPSPDLVRPPARPDGPGLLPSPPVAFPTGQTRLIGVMADAFGSEEAPGKLILSRTWVLDGHMAGADPGGGGIVWHAHRMGNPSERYVVKTVPSGLADKRTRHYIQQLGIRHEQRASQVVSDHIGQIIDHGDDQGFFYLVYPLYRPGSLWAYCVWKSDRRTLGWCAQVIYEVLSGLIDASALNLLHLDVKPSNIVLDGKHVRLIDWGLSRKWNASQPSTWVANGTPFFACPEQLIDPQQGWDTPRADLYGVGATSYWLLTGEAPLEHEARKAGEGSDHLAYRKLLVAGRRPQPVDDLVPGIPRPLGNLIDRWLSVDPDGRVPRGTPMEDSLRVARGQLSELQPGLPEMTVGRVTARRRRRPT